jgi:hypothetical protein
MRKYKRLVHVTAPAALFASDDVHTWLFLRPSAPWQPAGAAVSLARHAEGAVVITGNRASGDDSLEQTIGDHAGAHSLLVVTIGDPQRLIHDRAYASECAMRLLDLLEHIETLRGTGRLFIPWSFFSPPLRQPPG